MTTCPTCNQKISSEYISVICVGGSRHGQTMTVDSRSLTWRVPDYYGKLSIGVTDMRYEVQEYTLHYVNLTYGSLTLRGYVFIDSRRVFADSSKEKETAIVTTLIHSMLSTK